MSNLIHVAVGVILNDANQVLIALRNSSQHQGGLWEFPGGKVELKESVQQALARELWEEINLEVLSCSPLIEICHDYGDKQVKLDVWCVDQFYGTAKGREGQQVQWVNVEKLDNFDFPEANRAIISALRSRQPHQD